MKWRITAIAMLLFSMSSARAAQQFSMSGLVLQVDQTHKQLIVSCASIPGYMEAMVMPFEVREAHELDGLVPGAAVDFTLVVDKEASYAQHVRVRRYESVEQDPLTARRLKLLNRLSASDSATKVLDLGQAVPNFQLIDQRRQQVALSQFSGKVIAINFIYTSCALPNFCFRNSNTFGVLQRHFKEQMGRDLVLLTVTFDPQRDHPEALAKYAATWKADPATWHFLTGPVPDVQRVGNMFGMDYFPDEGLMNHNLHTAIVDQQGKLAANIEGNQFTAEQLVDLVQTVLDRKNPVGPRLPQHVALNAGAAVSTAR